MSALLVAALAASPALAQSYGDAATGLSISPPAGFAAKASNARGQYDAAIDISATGAGAPKPSGRDSVLCTLGFKAGPQNAEVTREAINAQMLRPEWQQLYRDMFGKIGTVSELVAFEHQGFNGIEAVVTPQVDGKPAPSRLAVFALETPRGRTVLSCGLDAAGFDKALPQLRQLRETMHAPE